MKFKGNFGELTLSIGGTIAIGQYQENGEIKGEFINNIFKGQWKNKGIEGLVEFTISEGKLNGKWKKGIEPGLMKGSWTGEQVIQTQINQEYQSNLNKDEVIIEISGRIPKYFFGALREEYIYEIERLVGICSNQIETPQDLLREIFSIITDNNTVDDIWKIISRSQLEEFPNFYELIKYFEDGGSNFEIINRLFTSISNGFDEIIFFEGDASIKVSMNDNIIVNEESLEDFAEIIKDGYSEDDIDSGEYNKIQEFIAVNEDKFGFASIESWGQNKEGVILLDDWFVPLEMKEFLESNESDYLVSIYFDDIITYKYSFTTDKFSFNDLIILKFSNTEDFRRCAESTIFNFIFYKNELIDFQKNYHRSKAVTLCVGEGRSDEGCNLEFLLEG